VQIASADEFEKVRCDSDLPKALIGQRSSNERVVSVVGKRTGDDVGDIA